MGTKVMLWGFAFFLAMASYSASNAYTAMNQMDVHDKFKEIGLLDAGPHMFPVPIRKPAPEFASR